MDMIYMIDIRKIIILVTIGIVIFAIGYYMGGNNSNIKTNKNDVNNLAEMKDNEENEEYLSNMDQTDESEELDELEELDESEWADESEELDESEESEEPDESDESENSEENDSSDTSEDRNNKDSNSSHASPGNEENVRYFKEKLSADELKSRAKSITQKEVKQLIYNEIDEHWDVISKEFEQNDKKKVYAFFLGIATRESTVKVASESGHEEGFGVSDSHAYGPLQVGVTAFDHSEGEPEADDVPEMYKYKWCAENFYDPIVSVHMGIRKLIHCKRKAEREYGFKGINSIKSGLKGYNKGKYDYSDDDKEYNAHYIDEIAALGGWYYKNDHFSDAECTWTTNPEVDRSDCWGWW